MVSGTRSKRTIPAASPTESSTRSNKRKSKKATLPAINQPEIHEDDTLDTTNVNPEGQDDDLERSSAPKPAENLEDKIFRSRFPQLELETFEDDLEKWTIASLRDAIFKQDSQRTTAHKDIKDLVKVLRMDFEKRILMVSLMGGVPEVVIWNLM